MSPDERLAELGLEVPGLPTPVAKYLPFKRDGQVYLSGQGQGGRHARSAVGLGSLLNNMTVEIEAVIRIND